MHKEKPEWIPNWRNESEYPDPEKASPQQWAWEFLRRSPLYQDDYAEFERKIVPEIRTQEKQGIITTKTARLFIKCLEVQGKDCLIPNMKLSADYWAGGYEGKPEYKLEIPWYLEYPFDASTNTIDKIIARNQSPFDESFEDFLKPIPAIMEPAYSRNICKMYGLSAAHNPARNSAPLFTGNQTTDSVIPYAVIGSALHPEFLQAESENEIIFKLDVQKPINEQLDFIRRMCKALKIQSQQRKSKPKATQWLRMLRLLDSLDYDRYANPKKTLASEWGVTPNNLTKMHLNAKKLRDGGYREIVSLEEGSSPELQASSLELARSINSIELHDDLTPEECKIYSEELRRKGLKRAANFAKQNESKRS